jgi:hypothetical protein
LSPYAWRGAGRSKNNGLARAVNPRPSRFVHKTFWDRVNISARTFAFEERLARTPSGTRTFFGSSSEVAVRSTITRVCLNKTPHDSQEIFFSSSKSVTRGEPFDRQRVCPTQQLPPDAERKSSRRRTFLRPFSGLTHHPATPHRLAAALSRASPRPRTTLLAPTLLPFGIANSPALRTPDETPSYHAALIRKHRCNQKEEPYRTSLAGPNGRKWESGTQIVRLFTE